MVKYSFKIKTTFLESLQSQKSPLKARFTKKTSEKDLVFAQGEFLRLVGCPNESLRLIIIYYTFKYKYIIETTLLVLLQSQNIPQRLDFDKTSYNHFVLARSEFLRLVGAPNEFLRLIIIYYVFKYLWRIKTTLLESHRSKITHLKARFRQNQL